jgi:hypothetical protein
MPTLTIQAATTNVANRALTLLNSCTLKLNPWYTLFALNTAVVLCGPSGSLLL